MQLAPGLSTYTFTWAFGVPGETPSKPMKLEELIELAEQHDLEVVQIADNVPLHEMSDEKIQAISELAAIKNIRLEIAARKMTSGNLSRYIAIAKQMDVELLRFVLDGDDFEPSVEEVIEIIKEALPKLESSGIILALENHDRLLCSDFVEIVEALNSPHLGICLDTVNSLGAGEGLKEVIEQLVPYTVNLHVKEFTVTREYHKMGFKVEGRPLGLGMLPLEDLVAKIPDNCRSAVLEQWTPPETTLDATIAKEARWAKESIYRLKEMINYQPNTHS